MFIQGISVEHVDGFFSFTLRAHGDKGKAFCFSADSVSNEISHRDFTSLRKEGG